jgi:glutathione synthase/RimK-type ligase-like ATP-grasp enzyme
LQPGEEDLLEHVRLAPVIFQEHVPAEVDLRVTLVGDRLFPAAISTPEGGYPHDYRIDLDRARIEAVTLPRELCRALMELMRRLGLVYGAVDMRRTTDERYVFLELNPAGQWLFVEDQTKQPITRALAELLKEHGNG